MFFDFWCFVLFFFFKQKTAYEMRISDWSSDVCSSDLQALAAPGILEAQDRHRSKRPLAESHRCPARNRRCSPRANKLRALPGLECRARRPGAAVLAGPKSGRRPTQNFPKRNERARL